MNDNDSGRQILAKRHWLARTFFFSLVASIMFPITWNWTQTIVPYSGGSPVEIAGGVGVDLVLTAALMLLVAALVAWGVQYGLLERGSSGQSSTPVIAVWCVSLVTILVVGLAMCVIW